MQVIPGPTGVEIAESIASELGVKLLVPEFKIFPDGESYLRIPESTDNEVLVVQSCHYPQDTNLFQLLNLVRTLKRLGTQHISVFVPYMCYARADRSIKTGEAISIQTVLELIESVGVDHLITLDIHNPEVLDLVSMRTTNIFASHAMKKYLEQYVDNLDDLQIVAPDGGAKDRAADLAKIMGVSYTHLEKYRNPDTGNVSLQLGDAELESSEIVIVDDIISTGGTLVEASHLLLVNGITRIHYLVTHALGTDAVDKLQEIGNGIVAATNSTNSIIGKFSPIDDLLRVI